MQVAHKVTAGIEDRIAGGIYASLNVINEEFFPDDENSSYMSSVISIISVLSDFKEGSAVPERSTLEQIYNNHKLKKRCGCFVLRSLPYSIVKDVTLMEHDLKINKDDPICFIVGALFVDAMTYGIAGCEPSYALGGALRKLERLKEEGMRYSSILTNGSTDKLPVPEVECEKILFYMGKILVCMREEEACKNLLGSIAHDPVALFVVVTLMGMYKGCTKTEEFFEKEIGYLKFNRFELYKAGYLENQIDLQKIVLDMSRNFRSEFGEYVV